MGDSASAPGWAAVRFGDDAGKIADSAPVRSEHASLRSELLVLSPVVPRPRSLGI